VPVIDGKIEKFYPEKNHENINDYPDNKDWDLLKKIHHWKKNIENYY
jgi:hypothetical protein